MKKLNLDYPLGTVPIYDSIGNREDMTDLDGLHDYTYDSLYRLTQATHPQPENL